MIRRIYIGAPRRRLRGGPTLTQQYIKHPCATAPNAHSPPTAAGGNLKGSRKKTVQSVPPRMCLQEEACSAAAQEEEEEGNSI